MHDTCNSPTFLCPLVKTEKILRPRKGQAGSGLMWSVRGSLGLGETGSQLDIRKFPGSGLGIQALDFLGVCFCAILKMQDMYVYVYKICI